MNKLFLLAGLFLLLACTPSQKETRDTFDSRKYYTIEAQHSHKMIGINHALNMVQWDDLGLERQHWIVNENPDKTVTILSVKNGYCVESLPDSTHAGNIRAVPCSNLSEQKWHMRDAGNGYFALINDSNGLALDVMEGAKENGWILLNWEYTGSDNQLFRMEKIAGDTVKIIVKHTGKALTMTPSIDECGANAAQWENVDQYWQQWQIIPVEGDFVKLINRHSGMALQLSDETHTQKIDAEQGIFYGKWNQQWQLEPKFGDVYAIRNRQSGEYLEVMVLAQANGANCWTYEYNGGENQLFKIKSLPSQ